MDFAEKAYANHAEDTVARFSGMPKGDYKGSFASFFRTSDMKSANDQVRDLFLKTIAGLFGGEKYIPDLVRDNLKLDSFGKGKPLTARRIKLVKTAIDMLGGGKFQDAASVGRATAMGYTPAELPKLARAATLYQQATNCTDAEAEAAALDPSPRPRAASSTTAAASPATRRASGPASPSWRTSRRGSPASARTATPARAA